MQGTRQKRIVLLVVLLVLLLVAALLLRNCLPLLAPAPVPSKEEATVRPLREVMLYFATPDGMGLESQMSEVEGCSDEEHCLLATVQALIDGPTGNLVAVLPAQTRVQQVVVDKGVAAISFSKELVAGHPGGSMTELLTVHALANTLAVNFPYIRKVRILVEGEPVETLKGHVDLREPISADFDFGRTLSKTGENRPEGE